MALWTAHPKRDGPKLYAHVRIITECKYCTYACFGFSMILPHVRESRQALILDSTLWIPDSGYCIRVFVSGTWDLDFNR